MVIFAGAGPALIRMTSQWLAHPPAESWAVTQRVDQGQFSLEVRASAETITVAEQLEVIADLTAPPGYTPSEPIADFTTNGWEITAASALEPSTAADGRSIWSWTWTIEPFLDGEYEIPEIRFANTSASARPRNGGSISSSAIPVTVGSLLLAAEAEQPDQFLGTYRGTPDAAAESSTGLPLWLRLGISLLAAASLEGAWLFMRFTSQRTLDEETFEAACTNAASISPGTRAAALARQHAIAIGIRELTGARLATLTRADAASALAGHPATLSVVAPALASLEAASFGCPARIAAGGGSVADSDREAAVWAEASEQLERALDAVAAALAARAEAAAA